MNERLLEPGRRQYRRLLNQLIHATRQHRPARIAEIEAQLAEVEAQRRESRP